MHPCIPTTAHQSDIFPDLSGILANLLEGGSVHHLLRVQVGRARRGTQLVNANDVGKPSVFTDPKAGVLVSLICLFAVTVLSMKSLGDALKCGC